MGYRDLVMSTEGISLNIVENAISNELTKEDLKRPGKGLKEGGIQKQEKTKSRSTHEIPQLQTRKHKAEAHGLDNLHGKETS